MDAAADAEEFRRMQTMRRARRIIPEGTAAPRRTRSGWRTRALVTCAIACQTDACELSASSDSDSDIEIEQAQEQEQARRTACRRTTGGSSSQPEALAVCAQPVTAPAPAPPPPPVSASAGPVLVRRRTVVTPWSSMTAPLPAAVPLRADAPIDTDAPSVAVASTPVAPPKRARPSHPRDEAERLAVAIAITRERRSMAHAMQQWRTRVRTASLAPLRTHFGAWYGCAA
jgi:hypothetical protein